MSGPSLSNSPVRNAHIYLSYLSPVREADCSEEPLSRRDASPDQNIPALASPFSKSPTEGVSTCRSHRVPVYAYRQMS
jgi:hypothetical protein